MRPHSRESRGGVNAIFDVGPTSGGLGARGEGNAGGSTRMGVWRSGGDMVVDQGKRRRAKRWKTPRGEFLVAKRITVRRRSRQSRWKARVQKNKNGKKKISGNV